MCPVMCHGFRRKFCFHSPQVGFLSDELVHELPALGIIQHHDLDTARAQVRLTAKIVLVLANDNPANAVEKTGSCACSPIRPLLFSSAAGA